MDKKESKDNTPYTVDAVDIGDTLVLVLNINDSSTLNRR